MKTLTEHFRDLARKPALCVLTHDDCDLLVYVLEDRHVKHEYRQDAKVLPSLKIMTDAGRRRVDR